MKELIEALDAAIADFEEQRTIYDTPQWQTESLMWAERIELVTKLRDTLSEPLPCTVTLPPDGREGGISLGRGTSFKKLVEALEYRRSVTP